MKTFGISAILVLLVASVSFHSQAFTCGIIDIDRNYQAFTSTPDSQGVVKVEIESPKYKLKMFLEVKPTAPQELYKFSEVNTLTGQEVNNSGKTFWMPGADYVQGFYYNGITGDVYCSSQDEIIINPSSEMTRLPRLQELDMPNEPSYLEKRYLHLLNIEALDFGMAYGLKYRDRFVLQTPSVILATHPVPAFDEGKTKSEFSLFLNSIKNKTVPVITFYTGAGVFPSNSNIALEDLDYFGESSGGQHKFQFLGIKSVVFTGGYVEQCLCETVQGIFRELVVGTTNLIFPLELVYAANWEPIHRIFLPGVPTEEAKKMLALATTLKEFEAMSLSKEEFRGKIILLVKDLILGIKSDGSSQFCPSQSDGELSANDFKVELYDQDSKGLNLIESFGSGSKIARMIFTDSQNVTQYLTDHQGPMVAELFDPAGNKRKNLPSRKAR